MRFTIVLLATLSLSLSGCGGDAAGAADDSAAVAAPIPVRTAVVEARAAAPAVIATGTLGAKEEIPLAFKIGGVIERISAEPGQSVRAGAILAQLVQTEIDAQVESAREGRDKARRDAVRVRALAKDSVATLSQLQDAETQLQVAEAQLRSAEFNRQYATVRAPADGIVLRRTAEAQQLIGPNVPIVLLRTERKGLVLRAGLSDRDAVRLSAGESGIVTFDAWPGVEFVGRIERISSAASLGSGTYEAEVSVNAGGRRLASGLIGKVVLAPRAGVKVPLIPIEALLEADGDSATVFLLDEDGRTARRRRVRVGFVDGSFAAIPDGIEVGRRVITAGASRLNDGSKVSLSADTAGRAK